MKRSDLWREDLFLSCLLTGSAEQNFSDLMISMIFLKLSNFTLLLPSLVITGKDRRSIIIN